jgi:hypothetical protein
MLKASYGWTIEVGRGNVEEMKLESVSPFSQHQGRCFLYFMMQT